jgi:hypothetical protein
MSDADMWGRWLLAGSEDVFVTDDEHLPTAGFDDPWGDLEIDLEPLTAQQRAHLAGSIAPAPTGPAAAITGFESLDDIDEIDDGG